MTEHTGVGLYARYALGGAICCSVTHSLVVPLDVVKTRLQLYPERYTGMLNAAQTIIKDEGASMLLQGLAPTAVGYAIQGCFKFGFYELFKKKFGELAGPEAAVTFRMPIWLAAGGCAEFFAATALCPLEATRIRLVSDPEFASGLVGGFTKIVKTEGVSGLYKGLPPILFKQIPYTMTKFAVFETATEAFYKLIIPKKDLNESQQLAVSLTGGIVAGVCAAIISQPADTVLSVINKKKTGGSVLKQIFTITGELGPAKLFTGVGARCIMVGSLTAGQFFIYDGIKQAFGLATAGGKK